MVVSLGIMRMRLLVDLLDKIFMKIAMVLNTARFVNFHNKCLIKLLFASYIVGLFVL